MSWLVLWLTCGALLACGQNTRNSPVAWSVDFGCREDAENAALVRLRILRGGCSGTAVLYDESVKRAADVSSPPALAEGRYGFEAKAFDAAERLLASVCAERVLPKGGTLTLVLESQSNACENAAPPVDGGMSEIDASPDAAISEGCGDTDQDGCDDCSYGSSPKPDQDGPEFNDDGLCDCVVFADASIVGQGDGKRWSTAFSNLQAAIDRAAELGDDCEVWVRTGTYHAYQTSVDDSFVLKREIDLYGGFAGGELRRTQRSSDATKTILDGRSADSAAQRVRHVLTGAKAMTLDGFTIVGGDASGSGDGGKGGAMLNVEVNPTLRNLHFRLHHAALGGAALYNLRADVLIERCTFDSNTTDAAGGAILDEDGQLTIRRSEFRDNESSDAQYGGAGLFMRKGNASLENVLFAGNLAQGEGGAILSDAAAVRLTNCTLAQNTASNGAGVMTIGARITLQNTIVYDNEPDALHQTAMGRFAVSYSDIEGGFAGMGNIAAVPRFVDAASGDYTLAEGSPCIDAANGDGAPGQDLAGHARADNSVADTGTGTPSYVDMGAYELLP